jgi:hypothetical protein
MMLLDLTGLSESRQDNATVTVDPDTGRMTGNGRFFPSFGTGNYVLYFCVDFHGSAIRDSGIWVNSRGSDQVEHVKISRGINSGGPLPGGAFVRFTTDDTVTAGSDLVSRVATRLVALPNPKFRHMTLIPYILLLWMPGEQSSVQLLLPLGE